MPVYEQIGLVRNSAMTMTMLGWATTLAVAEPDHICCSYLQLHYKYVIPVKMEKSSPSRHSSCQQGLAESRLGRHAMDEMLILACLTPEETGLHTNHVVQDTGSGCREDGSFAEHPRIFSLSKKMSYQSPVFLCISSFFAPLFPFFQYAFFFSLTSCSTLSFSRSFLCSVKTINYVRTAMLLETNGPSSWVFWLQQWLCRAE